MYVVLMIYNNKSTLTTHTKSTIEVNSNENEIIYNILPYNNNLYHIPLTISANNIDCVLCYMLSM